MKVHLIRHGQTTGDVENRYGGDYDDHLTELGKNQAANVAKNLTDCGIAKLLTSPRIRAIETADFIAKELDLTPEIVADVRERNTYGIITGMTKTEAAKNFPAEVAAAKDIHDTISGAESYDDFRERVLAALAKLSQNLDETLAVVTHGGPIKMIFRDVLKLGEMEVADCGFVVLEVDGKTCELVDSRGISPK